MDSVPLSLDHVTGVRLALLHFGSRLFSLPLRAVRESPSCIPCNLSNDGPLGLALGFPKAANLASR